MQEKNTSLARVDQILSETFRALNLQDKFKVYPIWKQWSQIVGETIAKKAQPDYVTGQTLVVSTTHPVWMSELQMQKKSILEKLKSLQLDFSLEDIRFRLRK